MVSTERQIRIRSCFVLGKAGLSAGCGALLYDLSLRERAFQQPTTFVAAAFKVPRRAVFETEKMMSRRSNLKTSTVPSSQGEAALP